MLELAKRGEPIRVVDDQRGCPTYTVDLARACVDLVESGCFGIYHVTNQGATTWYGFAREIFRCAGIQVDLEAVTSDQFPRPAKRPKNSELCSFPLREILEWEIGDWRQRLTDMVHR